MYLLINIISYFFSQNIVIQHGNICQVFLCGRMIVHKKENISISKSKCLSFFLALDVYKAIQKFFFIFNKDKDAGVFFYLLLVDINTIMHGVRFKTYFV